MKFEKHIFICTNQRVDSSRKSCGESCGMELVKGFKKELKDLKLNDKIRAQRAGCLDACEFGPSMVIYPEGVYYGGVRPADIKEIIEEHILNNRPVKRLMIDFSLQIPSADA